MMVLRGSRPFRRPSLATHLATPLLSSIAMARRPKSDGRCIRRAVLTAKTYDHVSPSCWYPDSTPSNVQRWTVPSCSRCNRELGAVEQELLLRLGLCVDPHKTAALVYLRE